MIGSDAAQCHFQRGSDGGRKGRRGGERKRVDDVEYGVILISNRDGSCPWLGSAAHLLHYTGHQVTLHSRAAQSTRSNLDWPRPRYIEVPFQRPIATAAVGKQTSDMQDPNQAAYYHQQQQQQYAQQQRQTQTPSRYTQTSHGFSSANWEAERLHYGMDHLNLQVCWNVFIRVNPQHPS